MVKGPNGMEAPRQWCHTGAHDGDHGARSEGPYRVTQNIMFFLFMLIYIGYVCDGSINKMIPPLIPT